MKPAEDLSHVIQTESRISALGNPNYRGFFKLFVVFDFFSIHECMHIHRSYWCIEMNEYTQYSEGGRLYS